MRRLCLVILTLFNSACLYAAPLAEKKSLTEVTDPVGFADFAQVFIGLAVVVLLILGMAWAIKRMGYVNTHASGALKVLGGIALTQRERLVLVQVGEKQLLIGVAPGHITTLHELEKNIETVRTDALSNESFAGKLNAYLRGEKS